MAQDRVVPSHPLPGLLTSILNPPLDGHVPDSSGYEAQSVPTGQGRMSHQRQPQYEDEYVPAGAHHQVSANSVDALL